ncbi:hypothetical protein M758_10G031700 [Ceratodon purpureus]|uniref:Uncharacterized protein n=1 Tax=Ceratodon purpureus TaxID=3225 RepID=A0A8T0GK06_CERPU|nr:hypothetical protein KC19_10G034300 [Ceratodon purpureus]KAG0602665.1 hypothetical protein M758_10G031700 [Ceratodon purpureus]
MHYAVQLLEVNDLMNQLTQLRKSRKAREIVTSRGVKMLTKLAVQDDGTSQWQHS